MERLLTEIDRGEALRYLGCRGAVPEELSLALDRAREAVMREATPRYVHAVFGLERDGELRLSGTGASLPGQDIGRFLSGCEKCVLFAATLGSGMERLFRRAQAEDMQLALLLDGCASAAIENVCDRLEEKFREEWRGRGLRLTGRFSPGYGDFPVLWQKELCALLDTERKIGLHPGSSGMLLPQKSVTAVLGVGGDGLEKRVRGCENCSLRETCAFRKEGKRCEK